MSTYGPRQHTEAKREATHAALWMSEAAALVAANTDLNRVEQLLLSVEATAARLRELTAKATA